MPELPEVEVIRKQLVPHLEGKHVVINIKPKSKYKGDSPSVTGKVLKVLRYGKALIILFAHGVYCVRLGMTGEFTYEPAGAILRITAEGSPPIYYKDPRRFGSAHFWDELHLAKDGYSVRTLESKIREWADEYLRIGQDVTVVEPDYSPIKSNRNVKVWLLDQSQIAGIGNIYAAEILFLLGIHPEAKASILNPKEFIPSLQKLFRKAIKGGGSTIGTYRSLESGDGEYQNQHWVYQKDKCSKCGSTITKMEQGGRSTYFCSTCQTKL